MALDEVEIAQRLQDHKGRIGSLEHRMDNAEEVIKERKLAETINSIKHKYGKNSILKVMNLEEEATTIKRNKLIGGHNAQNEDAD